MVSEKNRIKVFNALFFLFFLRIAYLIFLSPFIGIANNGDFQRLITTVGLDYPYDPWTNENYGRSFFNYVSNQYAYINPIENGWVQIFSVFPKIAIFLSRFKGAPLFDIRYMGAVNAIVYLLAVYLLLRQIYRMKGTPCYCLLAIAFLVFGDSYILQYLNSFYTEIGTLSGTILVWGSLIYGFIEGKNLKPFYKYVLIVWLGVVGILAIMSKQQDILVTIPFLLICWILLKRLDFSLIKRFVWVLCFVAVVFSLFTSNTAGGNTTSYNVTTMDLLSHSERPERHLEEMDFSEDEIAYISEGIGGNAFSHPDIYAAYGDSFTRGNELKIILREPQIVISMFLDRSEALFKDDPNLGNFTVDSGAEPKEKTTENRIWTSVKSSIYPSNFWFYIAVILVSFVFSIFAYIRKYSCLSRIPPDLFLIYALLPVSNLARFVTVLLGDSSHDDYKHFFMVNVEFDVIFITLICLVTYIVIVKVKNLNDKRKRSAPISSN